MKQNYKLLACSVFGANTPHGWIHHIDCAGREAHREVSMVLCKRPLLS